ncbi:MAG: T9SS type A sorting domain-containing protein [candidate division Zixibacteria bacterium]|nr:T9SS type A sorting domain-containing protein [candidate division Zixibacteria bacterium]
MSRNLRCFLVLLFALAVFASTGLAQITYQASFSEGDMIFGRKDGFDVVSLKGAIRSKDYGYPDLPIKLICLILPNDSKVADVSITDTHHILLEGDFLIFPSQPDEKTDAIYQKEWVKPDPGVYNSDSFYPPRLVEIVEEGYLAGSHLITLAVHPLQYKPKSRKLLFYTQLDIRVELKGSQRTPLTSQIQRRSDKAQRIYEKILHQLVDNKNDITNFICKNFQSVLFKANIDSSTYHPYLVITSSELKSAFLPLVEWKTRKGTGATIVCIDSILLSYSGRDDAEKLRNFLIEAYQNGTNWVLLGGDEDVVPIRYAYPTITPTPPPINNQQICDLYFSDVDGEWDLDNDGVWGEPQQDNPDIYPDLFVGRVPAGDTAEAKAFVEKLLSYEKNPGEGSTDYLTRTLWMSSDQMRDWNWGEGQHHLVSEYIPSNFYQDLSALIESPTGDAQNPIGPGGETCVEMMNQGWGIVGVLAHGKSSGFVAKSNLTNGTPKSWVYTFPGENDGHGHLPNSDNEQKYGIMYSISCSQSAIDVEGETPCVGEFYSLTHQKGGVAFLGYSRWGWVSVSYKLCEKFLEYLFDSDLGHHIGVAEALSRCAYPSYRDINYGHNLFGDPEMPVWTQTPSDLAVVHPDGVTIGWRTINFSVTSQGSGVGDALVCLTLRDRLMFLGETDPDGNLSCEVNLDDVGEMSVVVTKPNFIPYEDSITVSLLADVDEDEANWGMESFELFQNYPNPFNPVTSIQYSVGSRQTKTADGSFAHTTLKIYNVLGQRVRTLVDEPQKAGNYQVDWDGKDDWGKDVSSGIYFYTLKVNNYRETKKITLLK